MFAYYSEHIFQVMEESLTRNLTEGKQEEEEVTPERRSSRQSSGQSSSSGSTTILTKKCIFCIKYKYVKNSKNREKLTNCLQLRADGNIRELATKRNDAKIIAVTTDELIAKEACYHFTCYRDYTRPIKPISTRNQDNVVTDDGTSEVIKFLVGLHEKADIVDFRKLQNMVTTASGKKNLKRNIETKTKDFKFINHGKEILVYPVSLKVEDLVILFHEARTHLTKFEKMDSKEKTVQMQILVQM